MNPEVTANIPLAVEGNQESRRQPDDSVHATVTPLTSDEFARKPWKYIGYRGYASFITSDSDFLIFRRFDSLNARVTLALQDQTAELEEKLNALENTHSRREAEDRHNGSFRSDRRWCQERHNLLNQIARKTRQYTPRQDVKSTRNWHYNHDNRAIAAAEQRYLEVEDDLISIIPREKAPLRRALDSSRLLRTLPLWRHDKVPPNLHEYNRDTISYFSDKRMDKTVSTLIVVIGAAMLIAPIWILQAMYNPKLKLAVITAFITIFIIMVSLATVAKPFETLGAAAAYSAVLMVFLQLGTTN